MTYSLKIKITFTPDEIDAIRDVADGKVERIAYPGRLIVYKEGDNLSIERFEELDDDAISFPNHSDD